MTQTERRVVERAIGWLTPVQNDPETPKIRMTVARLELEDLLKDKKVRRRKPHGVVGREGPPVAAQDLPEVSAA